jgi:hypothetical protein
LLEPSVSSSASLRSRILAPLAQGGQPEWHLGEAIVEVIAESVARPKLVQVSTRGGQHPHVHRVLAIAADGHHGAGLQRSQQRKLHARRSIVRRQARVGLRPVRAGRNRTENLARRAALGRQRPPPRAPEPPCLPWPRQEVFRRLAEQPRAPRLQQARPGGSGVDPCSPAAIHRAPRTSIATTAEKPEGRRSIAPSKAWVRRMQM